LSGAQRPNLLDQVVQRLGESGSCLPRLVERGPQAKTPRKRDVKLSQMIDEARRDRSTLMIIAN
jgi:hypothetical protein